MARSSFPPIAETLEALRRRRESDLRLKTRLHLLVLIQAGDAETQVEAAGRLALHPNTIWRWLRPTAKADLRRCSRLAGPGLRRLEAPSRRSRGLRQLHRGQQWLKAEFDLEVPYKTVHKLVRYRLKAKLKRPRPRHDKKMRAYRPLSPKG